jgi:CPA2 family monovalent cation:H+ antiporter-2
MTHHTPLIGTIVAGLVIAFMLGALAHRLRITPIAGYLLAGVAIGPATPGFVADSRLAGELAEIGVILLMFGVGLHFSMKDLLSVKRIAVPGAVVQIVAATAMGTALGLWLGWPLLESAIFGLALSVASTVVLLKALQGRDLVQTERGRIAVGWLIVEDLAMVLALVLLPVIVAVQSGQAGQGWQQIVQTLGLIGLKVAGFMIFMLLVARRFIPSLLHWVAHSGSRELFRLAVLAIALGVAFGAALVFGVSFALGAFFAGMILGETQLSRRATEEILPLRDAFAVLFFVSVGMLFRPDILVEQPLEVLATVAIIVLGKSLAAYAIVRWCGHPSQTAITVAASLAQIGEFSFILAALGIALGAMSETARDLILAGAIFSILLNPVLFSLLVQRERPTTTRSGTAERPPPSATRIILVGYGRVGRRIARRLPPTGADLKVIEDHADMVEAAKQDGLTVIVGDATSPGVLEDARIAEAAVLFIAIREGVQAGVIAARARKLNPALRIIARVHSDEEMHHLSRWGADITVLAEEETAAKMAQQAAR